MPGKDKKQLQPISGTLFGHKREIMLCQFEIAQKKKKKHMQPV